MCSHGDGRIAAWQQEGVVGPRMVMNVADDLRRLFLSSRLLVDLRITNSEGKEGEMEASGGWRAYSERQAHTPWKRSQRHQIECYYE